MKKFLSALLLASVFSMILPGLTFAAPQKVKVVNNDNRPVPVYNVGVKQPFQWGEMNVDFDPTQGTQSVSFTVPSNQRLVIEYVSGWVFVDQGIAVDFSVSVWGDGVLVSHWLPLSYVGPAGGFGSAYRSSQKVTLYADPGTEVVVSGSNNLLGRASMHAGISGYLIDAD